MDVSVNYHRLTETIVNRKKLWNDCVTVTAPTKCL